MRSTHFENSTLRQRGKILLKDLRLLGSLYLAHFIVWRTLRIRRKQRLWRLKRLRLIDGQASTLIVNGE